MFFGVFLKCHILMCFLFKNFENVNADLMVKGKCKRCAAQKSNTSHNDLSSKLREHGRHAMLSFLSSLPIPVLRIFDIDANRFYAKITECRNNQMYEAAILTRCYPQHALYPLSILKLITKAI